MKRYALLAALVLGGACSTTPSYPKPTATDVAKVKDEIRILGAKAILNAPWSHEQVAEIAAEVTRAQHRVDQLATAAGIDTTAAPK